MAAIHRAPRRLVIALVLTGLLAALGAPAVAAGSFAVRLEAGPQRGVSFDSAWRIAGTKSVTYSGPATVTASERRLASGNIYLRVTSGALAGWWVKEGRMAHVPGWIGQVSYSPARSGTLPAGTYTLYRFDTAGALTAAKRRAVTSATTFPADARAIINGRSYVRIAAGAWAGWWVPGSTTAPIRVNCTAGRPPTGTGAVIVRSVPAATGEIALTFDMGGRLTDALAILRYLELERVCATIFPTATMAQTEIGLKVMAEIRLHPELFELGNHTVAHCNLRDGGGGASCPPAGTRPSAAFVTKELRDADAVFMERTLRSSAPYWRPPYGAVDSTLAGVAASAGYPYTMMWSTDTIDWRPVTDGGPTAAQVAAKVIAGRTAGGIVLMHLGGYNTRNALPAMVEGLRAAGYTPTSLSALYRAGR